MIRVHLGCPRRACPNFGHLTIRYMPDRHCLELKSLKQYLQSYRNLGIFQENIVNRVLEDVVRWAKPEWVEVKGDFDRGAGFQLSLWPTGQGPEDAKPKRSRGGE